MVHIQTNKKSINWLHKLKEVMGIIMESLLLGTKSIILKAKQSLGSLMESYLQPTVYEASGYPTSLRVLISALN